MNRIEPRPQATLQPRFNQNEWVVGILTGVFIFALAPQVFIFQRFTLVERASLSLILLLTLSLFLTKSVDFLVLPVAQILLLAVMAISLVQFFRLEYNKDLLAYFFIVVFAVLAQYLGGNRSAVLGGTIAAVLLLFATAFYVLFLPQDALESDGFLRGSFAGKNSLAISLLLSTPAILAVNFRKSIKVYIFQLITIGTLFAAIFATGSRTALVTFSLTMAIYAIGILYSVGRKKIATLCAGALVSVVLLAVAFWDTFTTALGKRNDLTGRIPLWDVYWQLIQQRPLQGYGWQVDTLPDTYLGQAVISNFGNPINNANNELLNIWALVGIAGPILDIVIIFLLIFGGWRAIKVSPTIAKWVLCTGILVAVLGIAELSTMHPDGWAVVALASCALGVEVLSFNRQKTSITLLFSKLFVFIHTAGKLNQPNFRSQTEADTQKG